jgi:antitoxin component of RelBE/YafQ-DinJ toxin-antitoxin module
MADKKQITINLDEKSIEKLDALCSKLDMNRAQVLRLLFSGSAKSVQLVVDTLVSMEGGLSQ